MSPTSTSVSVPEIGQEAPDFNLPDVEMKSRSIEEFRGKKLVIAFFPAAESPVCTTEMCVLRDSLAMLKSLGAQVVGISVDSPFANKIFTENRHLNFPILSDYRREVINKYGIVMANLGPLEGYNAAKRSVFVLDESGLIRYRWISDNPQVEPNYDEIRSALEK
jgi:glutaredoxin-dependent peroxiredoxin